MGRRGAVLFDAAGTLIELRESVGANYARVARAFGVAADAARLDAAFRRAFAAAPAMAFPEAAPAAIAGLEKRWWHRVVAEIFAVAAPDLPFDDFDAFFERLFDVMGDPNRWREIPRARGVLSELRALGWSTAIVSNFDQRLPRILEALELHALFDAVVLSADVGAAKPDAAIFACALERLGVPAERAIFVGDDASADVAGARAVGMRAIHVAPPAKLDSLLEALANFASSSGAGSEGAPCER